MDALKSVPTQFTFTLRITYVCIGLIIIGTYGPVEMLATAAECTQCDPGYYCSETGRWNVTGPCAPGYYCETGVDTPAPNNNNTGLGGRSIVRMYCIH